MTNGKLSANEFAAIYELSSRQMDKVKLFCEVLKDNREGVYDSLQDAGIFVELEDLQALDV